METIYSILIVTIALVHFVAAWKANKAFNNIRRTEVGDWFVGSLSMIALSWGILSLGAQRLFLEPSELRTVFITLGLVTKLIGILGLLHAIVMLARANQEFK